MLTPEERQKIAEKLKVRRPLTLEEARLLWDHIEEIEAQKGDGHE